MSLSWDLTHINNYKTVCWIPAPTDDNPEEARLNPVTETLIWRTMVVGLGRITEANAQEWWRRLRVYERVSPAMEGWPAEHRLTAADVYRHIGLRTNATDLSHTKWLQHIVSLSNEGADEAWEAAAKEGK